MQRLSPACRDRDEGGGKAVGTGSVVVDRRVWAGGAGLCGIQVRCQESRCIATALPSEVIGDIYAVSVS